MPKQKHQIKKIIIPIIILIALVGFIITDYFFNILIFRYIIIDDELSTEEIDNISKSIAAISCSPHDNSESQYYGTASYLLLEIFPKNSKSRYIKTFVTNNHVAELHELDDDFSNFCNYEFSDNGKLVDTDKEIGSSILGYDSSTVRSGDIVDLALLYNDYYFLEYNSGIEVKTDEINKIQKNLDHYILDSNGEAFPICKENNVIGKKVWIFGYPSSSQTVEYPENKSGLWLKDKIYTSGRHLIVSEGIISGKQDQNYFTTAIIDTGSSGGLAVLKKNGKPCILGIPTWGSMGDLTTLGIIQPFNNIYTAGFDWDKISNLWEEKTTVRK